MAVVVTNPLERALESATVEIPWADVKAKAPDLKEDVVAVDEASGEQLLTQVYEDSDGVSKLLIQANFPAKGTRNFRIGAGKGTDAEPMTARFVPERIDDFAWENDRVAFRVYGPKAQAMLEAGKKAGVISNGIDIWAKSVSRMVVDDWYRRGDYHKDHGEGADFFKVGPTLGAGAPALRKPDGTIVPWPNFSAHRVIANGPVRLAFELDYPEIATIELASALQASPLQWKIGTANPGN